MLLPLLALAGALLPTDSTRWIVSNHGREAGDLVVVRTADSAIVRWVFTDRNRGTRVEMRYRLNANGEPVSGEQRPVLADGTAGTPTDGFEVGADSVWYGTPGSPRRMAVKRNPTSYVGARGGTPWEQAALARFLLAQPSRAASVMGTGSARAEVIADTTLRLGSRRQRARLVMVYRNGAPTPTGVWLDERGQLLATDVQWFITVRPDLRPLLPSFRAIELKWRNAVGEAVAKRVVTPLRGDLVIRNGSLFDSERGVMVPSQTVVVRGDRIVSVGPDATAAVSADATVIDATGKTIMPGMWEMHTHLQVASQSVFGAMQLAQGLTTARDLASDIDVAVSQRDRERAGKLASPRIILGGFMEGPLAWAGPTEVLVSTEAEARAWVARYDSLGYRQIKLYNITHPDLVPVIATEARKRGMILSGHIPRGMSMQAAVALGYDEIQHAAFFFSNFFPDSLYLPQMRAYSQVATAVAPTFDVDSPAMTSLIEFLAQRRTVVDGTFNLWIGGGASVVGAGGSGNQEKADSAYMKLIRRLYAAGVPLVAGTDNAAGATYRRELEMYERAGIPRAKILQIATIDAARFMKDDAQYGSIREGKVADLLVVNGNPLEKISDLQKLEVVIRGGRYYKVSDLMAAVNARSAVRNTGAADGLDGCGAHFDP
ncbi:MAG: amidohydrolase family protein [Gemmatimonadetes bacterium]|nr:amidohydrolase family protein [Gemmatimonadota bacterium]